MIVHGFHLNVHDSGLRGENPSEIPPNSCSENTVTIAQVSRDRFHQEDATRLQHRRWRFFCCRRYWPPHPFLPANTTTMAPSLSALSSLSSLCLEGKGLLIFARWGAGDSYDSKRLGHCSRLQLQVKKNFSLHLLYEEHIWTKIIFSCGFLR